MTDKKSPPTSTGTGDNTNERKSGAEIKRAIKDLPYLEREVVKLRSGIGDGFIYTLEEVAHIFQVTPEQIREAEANAMEEIIKNTTLTTEKIEGFFDSVRKEKHEMSVMRQKTLKFLQDTKTFYLATTEDDKPRVRPFGLVVEHDDKLWFGTANTKVVFRQLQANPFVEISATSSDMEWIRLSGKAVFENNIEVKQKAFELLPMLANIYKSPDDPVFEVFYLANATVTFQSLGNYGTKPKVHKL